MSDTIGSIRKVTLDGVTFDVFSDTNISEVGSAYESTSIPTSGRNLHKMVRRPENREGVVLACTGFERDLLKDIAEKTDDIPMSYEVASGDVYRATGWIEFETRETEEGRATIQMHPRNEWASFLA